ncbi:tautomerase family protein [Cupriavidus pampae]|uniref:Uncharacterized protein n=1 Tax=Cupriavidus pampae TaxID=659251 RepID=A0ABN7ZIS0_9BURK|nr:tautomerase family protein [Cupriavidus pampae]CAG9185644.1 hypothetical protein LMG32289_06025 [Cupriavidus pampae]
MSMAQMSGHEIYPCARSSALLLIPITLAAGRSAEDKQWLYRDRWQGWALSRA